jgi:hypothetical protein
MIKEHFQNLEGLFLHPHAHAILSQFPGLQVNFKGAEVHCGFNLVHFRAPQGFPPGVMSHPPTRSV